jgi:hypothetical protein
VANYNMTPKQIKFAELVALEGYKLVNAWLEAYDSDPATPRTTSRPAASKLASQPRVAEYIQQLRDEAREEVVRLNSWGKYDVIARATKHMEGAVDAKQFSAANGALQQIADISALMPSHRVEISGSLDVNHYASLSMEQLLALSDRADALPPAPGDDSSVVNVQGRLVED